MGVGYLSGQKQLSSSRVQPLLGEGNTPPFPGLYLHQLLGGQQWQCVDHGPHRAIRQGADQGSNPTKGRRCVWATLG